MTRHEMQMDPARRELLTGHQYEAGLGLSYTFGSIFSNVVNPRF